MLVECIRCNLKTVHKGDADAGSGRRRDLYVAIHFVHITICTQILLPFVYIYAIETVARFSYRVVHDVLLATSLVFPSYSSFLWESFMSYRDWNNLMLRGAVHIVEDFKARAEQP